MAIKRKSVKPMSERLVSDALPGGRGVCARMATPHPNWPVWKNLLNVIEIL